MARLKKLNLTKVRPEGWMLDQLHIQMNGLSGVLYDIWDSVGSFSGWLGGTGDAWERVPYYLDGLLPLSYYLDDSRHMEICRRFLEWTLSSQTEDGNFGPVTTRSDYWSRYAMLKVLLQYHEITGEARILDFAANYFRYIRRSFPKNPPINWSKARVPELLVSMKYVYEQTGDPEILAAAREIEAYSMDWVSFMEILPFPRPSGYYMTWDAIKDYNHSRLDEIVPFHATHIVNVTMGLKHPSLRNFFCGGVDDQAINRAGIAQLDRFHGTPSGCINGDEHLSGTDPRQGAELCSVVEYMYSLGVMTELTGDPVLADKLELLAYNALPATITEDFMAHQYLQQTNQVQVDIRKRPWYNNRDDASIFGLEPNFGCCTANMHQGWPKLANTFWYTEGSDTLVAMVHAPSSVEADIAGGTLRIRAATEYPFRDTVTYTVLENTASNPTLKVRVPGWCSNAQVRCGGETRSFPVENGCLVIRDELKTGDTIQVTFPMEVRVSVWHQGSLSVHRGPLLFGLDIRERFETICERGGVKDYNVYADTPWNYALCGEETISVEEQPLRSVPFGKEKPAVVLHAIGREAPTWVLENGNTSDLPKPEEITGQPQTIRLIPYGCTKLRIAEFPAANKS